MFDSVEVGNFLVIFLNLIYTLQSEFERFASRTKNAYSVISKLMTCREAYFAVHTVQRYKQTANRRCYVSSFTAGDFNARARGGQSFFLVSDFSLRVKFEVRSSSKAVKGNTCLHNLCLSIFYDLKAW